MTEQSFFEKAANAAIVSVISVAFGWLLSAFQFQKKLDQFESRIVQPLRERISKFEGAAGTFVTREELDKALQSLRGDVKEWMGEIRESLHSLSDKLDRLKEK